MSGEFAVLVMRPFGVELEVKCVDSADPLTSIQGIVGGFVEVAKSIRYADDLYIDVIVNEDGRALGLPENCVFHHQNIHPILGNVVLVAHDKITGDWVSLNPETLACAVAAVKSWSIISHDGS